jgi:hypothetical protein
MIDNTISDLDLAEQEALNLFTYEVSDEALEAAAGTGQCSFSTGFGTGRCCACADLRLRQR